MIAAWTPGPLVFLDLETSGANLANDRVIEIGLIAVDADGAREWSVLVNPERSLSPFITRLTGIDDAMLSKAPTFRQLADELLSWLRGRLLIAHNARFDYGFLRSEFQRLGIEFRSVTLCTVKLSRRLFPEHPRHNLDALIARHGLRPGSNRHRALGDARLLWELWRCWHQLLPTAAVRDAVAAILGQPELPVQIPATIIDDLPEAAGAYAFLAAGERLLLVKRSTNIRRDVLAQLANADRQAALFRETVRIEWREAAGELGARLQVRLLAKAGSVGNRDLRQMQISGELCSWQVLPGPEGDFQPRLVFADDVDFAVTEHLFGLYSTRAEAIRVLRRLADAQRLCYRRLGLEAGLAGQPCSAYRQKTCRGACIGKESAAVHGSRLLNAVAKFKLQSWPYEGPVAVFERDDFGMREDIHLLDRWRHIVTLRAEEEVHALLRQGLDASHPFEADTYRLLVRGLQQGKVRVLPLPVPHLP